MKVWLKGGLIALIISLILIGIFFTCMFLHSNCKEEWCGIECLMPFMPFVHLLSITGGDYFVAILNNGIDALNIFTFIIGTLFFILLGIFIGFIIDKNNSLKEKIIFIIIILLIFGFLFGFKHYLIYSDNKILSENKSDENFLISDYKICQKISIYQEYQKKECLQSELYPEEKLIELKNFMKNSPVEQCKNSMSDNCILQIAVKTKNVNACEYVPYGKEYCTSQYYIEVSSNLTNSSLCENLEKGNSEYNQCKFNIYKTGTNIKLCDELQNTIKDWKFYFRDDCIKEIAFNQRDIKLCSPISDLDRKEQCNNEIINQIAIDGKNIKLCENSTKINSCKFGVIIELKDKKLCSELAEPERQWCLERASSQDW